MDLTPVISVKSIFQPFFAIFKLLLNFPEVSYIVNTKTKNNLYPKQKIPVKLHEQVFFTVTFSFSMKVSTA